LSNTEEDNTKVKSTEVLFRERGKRVVGKRGFGVGWDKGSWAIRSEQIGEIFDGQFGIPKDRAQ
jgi:ribosomal protein L27